MIKKIFQTAFLISLTLIMFTLVSCDPSKKYEKEEQAEIDAYLQNNSTLNFELKPSGLYYLEVVEGTGLQAYTGDTAYLKYTGKFLDGRIFDTNTGTTDSLIMPVNSGWLIQGFDEGMTYMKVGGKAMFLVPSDLAYGRTGYYSIPGYTPILFDVELLKIVPGPGK